MLRALLAGVSGLRNHQTRMDVIGNNIANVSTVGYKASRATFQETLAMVLSAGQQADGNRGGTNPMQVGTGTNIASIDQLFGQGDLEITGRSLDLAIHGGGLFVLGNEEGHVYTRAGNFQLGEDGRLLAAGSGLILQGVNADSQGNLSTTTVLSDIRIGLDEIIPAQQTTQIRLAGNLDAAADVGDVHTMSITVYDGAGNPHDLRLRFTNTGPRAWSWTADCETAPVTPSSSGAVSFNDDGTLADFTYPDGAAGLTLTPENGAPFEIAISGGEADSFEGLSGFAGSSNALAESQDGYQAGELIDINVDATGTVNGYFSNGVTRSLARIAIAAFNNPSALVRSGNSVYEASSNSGIASIGFAGDASASRIIAGALEGSNVDFTQEFSNMIITQRGFQANARVITTADEMLSELINLRR